MRLQLFTCPVLHQYLAFRIAMSFAYQPRYHHPHPNHVTLAPVLFAE